MTNSTPTHDEIAAQAYEIYLREGCIEGRDMEHWLQAEAELRARSNGNENNARAAGVERSQSSAASGRAVATPRNGKPESILPNSVVPPSAPIAQVMRTTTPRRNPGKREAAAAK